MIELQRVSKRGDPKTEVANYPPLLERIEGNPAKVFCSRGEVGLLTLKVDNKEEAALNLRGLPSMEERAQESAPTIESGIESESDAFLLWKNESNRVEAIDGVAEVAIVDGTVERGREIRKAAPEVTEGEEEQL
ncbi:hypothetical protein GW17_00019650 [Ensete ventricosum]|nr:hypothetical protein GW17_00019650 [Ensete ventricosum]